MRPGTRCSWPFVTLGTCDMATALARNLRKMIKAMPVELVEIKPHKGHYHIRIKLPTGAVRLLTTSGSPGDAYITVDNVRQDINRLLRGVR